MDTAQKTIFSFSRRPKKMVFPKNITLEFDLSFVIGKDNIYFSENIILLLILEMKDDLSLEST